MRRTDPPSCPETNLQHRASPIHTHSLITPFLSLSLYTLTGTNWNIKFKATDECNGKTQTKVYSTKMFVPLPYTNAPPQIVEIHEDSGS